MRCRGVLGLAMAMAMAMALGLGACAKDEPPMPASCLEGDKAVARALDGAPRQAVLHDGTPLSLCVERVRSGSDLQALGLSLSRVADRLGVLARQGDRAAASRLGFLAGAVRRGSGEHGIGAELAHRIESAARRVDAVPALRAALEQGFDAGRARG